MSACHSGKRTGISLEGRHLSPAEREELSAELMARASEIQSYRFIAATSIQGEKINERYRQVFVFERPEKLRVEFLPQQTFYSVALLVAREGQFTFLNVEDKQAYQAALTPRVFKRVLGIPVSYGELFAFLSARLPLEFFAFGPLDARHFDLISSGGDYVVAHKAGRYVAQIDGKSKLIKRLIRRDDFNESLLYTADFSDAKGAGPRSSIPFNQHIQIEITGDDLRAELRLDSISANTPVKPGLFEAQIPADYSLRQDAPE